MSEGKRSFDADRLDRLLDALTEMAADAGAAAPLPVSEAHDELDAVAYAVNVLLGELRFASEARAALEAEKLANAEAAARAEKRRSAQLTDAKDAADEANRAKSAFLRNLSHELRTPVTVLIASAELLARPTLDDTERRALAERFLRSARGLLGLLDDVLDLAKIEAGRVDLRPARFTAAALLDDLRLTFAGVAGTKGLRFEIDNRAGDAPLRSDPQRIRQILVNLVSNALKYTRAGHIRLTASLDATRDHLRFSVEDTGAGIADGERAKLFLPFGRTDGAAAVEGTGLGLHLSNRLAEALGGTLQLAESAPGKGSRFELEIPVTADQAGPAAPGPRVDVRGLRVLFVDDNADIRALYTMLLESEGAAVTTAASGDEALALARSREFDLVFMDVHMPGTNGLEAVATLRREGYRQPIIALTADADRERREESLAAGYTAHVSKPIDFDDFLAVIHQHAAR